MNEKTHDACDKNWRGLSASSDHLSSIHSCLPVEQLLQSEPTDKHIEEGDCSFEKQPSERPSSDDFEELFCPSLRSAPWASVVFRTRSEPHSDVVKQGYLGKQEQKHRRYFVLRAGSHSGPSRLEWYKTQEQFIAMERSAGDMMLFGSYKQGVIFLRCCLGVSQISSSRKDDKVALYAKDQTLVMVGKDKQEQHEWYVAIQKLMEEELKDEGEGFDEEDAGYCTLPPAAFFKQVWPVTVKPRGLGRSKALAGEILLCLTASCLVLVRVGHDHDLPSITLPLLAVRRFGHLNGSFFLELGRSAPHGPGEIWMEARHEGNSALAQQIHEAVREVVRALRVIPDFNWTATTSMNSSSLAQCLPALKHSRPKHREKLVPRRPYSSPQSLVPCESLHSQSQSDLNPQETQKPESVSLNSLCPLGAQPSSEADCYMDMKTDQQSPVREHGMESCESSEERALGYMLMSPQVSQTVHQDEYVTMASPQKRNQSTRMSFSFLQMSFSSGSDGHSPRHASPHRITEQTPPPWTLSPVQQSFTGADQPQLSMSCPSRTQNITPWTSSSPVRRAGVLRPRSLFSGHFGPQCDTEDAPETSVRRYLLSCLPSCLQADRS